MTDDRQPTTDPGQPAKAAPAGAAPPTPPASSAAKRPARASRPTDGDESLLAILDRLTGLLERSDLTELEVGAGETGLILRKATALPAVLVAGSAGAASGAPGAGVAAGDPTSAGSAAAARPSVKAPLTGIFYNAPGPGSAPYVLVGGEIAVGQVIGLIEAMKLFNEIKSDLAGRVVRVVAETGALVKARQPLIEVEPL